MRWEVRGWEVEGCKVMRWEVGGIRFEVKGGEVGRWEV